MPYIIMLSIEWLISYIMQHFTEHLLATKIRETSSQKSILFPNDCCIREYCNPDFKLDIDTVTHLTWLFGLIQPRGHQLLPNLVHST